MSQEHRDKLRGKRILLVTELTPKDDLLNYLFQDKVLTLDQFEEINSVKTRKESAERLLSILPFCGEDAYPKFIKALRDTNKGYLADALEKYDPHVEHDVESENGALVPVHDVLGAMGGNTMYGNVPFVIPPQGVTITITPKMGGSQ